jgi:xanthine phosphoribosyltransferase
MDSEKRRPADADKACPTGRGRQLWAASPLANWMPMTDRSPQPADHVVTWDEVHRDARALVDLLPPRPAWTGIIAIARGGLVPATIVAREMSIRMLDTLCVAAYDDRKKSTLTVLKIPEAAVAARGDGWLVIDDLVDTGATLKAARELMPLAHFATVYGKPAGLALVDTFVHRVPQESWVTFPWDVNPRL